MAEVSPWNEMPNEFLLCTQIVCGMRHWKHQAGGHIFLNKKKQSKGDIAVRSMDRSPLARRVAESRVIMYTHVANYVGADLIMKNGQRFNSNDKYSALPGILFSIFFSFIIRLFTTSMASKSRSVFFFHSMLFMFLITLHCSSMIFFFACSSSLSNGRVV